MLTLTEEQQINPYIASFGSILALECEEFLGDQPSFDKQVKLCEALFDLVDGKIDSDSLHAIDFKSNFSLTHASISDPKKVLPNSPKQLSDDDKKLLVEKFKAHLIWYVNKIVSALEVQAVERSVALPASEPARAPEPVPSVPVPALAPGNEPSVPAQLPSAWQQSQSVPHEVIIDRSRVEPVVSGLQARVNKLCQSTQRYIASLAPDHRSRDAIMQDSATYTIWFAQLDKAQQKTLNNNYDKLISSNNPQLSRLINTVNLQLANASWSPDQKKKAYLYYFYHATLSLPTPNRTISLDAKLEKLKQDRIKQPDVTVAATPSIFSYDSHRRYYGDPVLTELREIREDLRHQRFVFNLQNMYWQYSLFNLYNSYSGHCAPVVSNVRANRNAENNKDDEKDKNKSSLAALLAVLALCTTAFAGIIYAGKKLINSLSNIFSSKKVLRSLFRIGGIIAGACSAIIISFYLGLSALIIAAGSSLIGANILSIFIAGSLGLGCGALAAKYIAKLTSYFFYNKEINPTSPEKYWLGAGQKQYLETIGVNLDEFNKLMKAIRDYKKQEFGFKFWSSWPWTKAKQAKNDLNMIIKELKEGKILGKVIFNSKTYDLFAKRPAAPSVVHLDPVVALPEALPSATVGYGMFFDPANPAVATRGGPVAAQERFAPLAAIRPAGVIR